MKRGDPLVFLAAAPTASSLRWDRPSKGRFYVFAGGDACGGESCVIDRRLGLWARGDKGTRKARKGEKREQDM